MSQYIDNFIRQHKEYFNRNKSFIEANKWDDTTNYKSRLEELSDKLVSLHNILPPDKIEKEKKSILSEIRDLGEYHQKNKASEFKQENELTASILGRLSAFIKEVEKIGERRNTKANNFIKETLDIINLHLSKCDKYLNYSLDEIDINSDSEEGIEYRGQEIKFQDEVFQKKIKIQDTTESLNIGNEIENLEISFFKGDKAPLIMREPLCLLNEDIKYKTDSLAVNWNVCNSKEMFINMKPSDIPKYNSKKHFFDQDPVVLQFWSEEMHKIKNGINIGGFYINGWLYFHLNFFRTPIAQEDGSEPNIQGQFRDNEWFVGENINKCVSKDYPDYYSKAMLIYGTRRFGKSVILASLSHWRTITKFNSFGTIVGGNSSDLSSLTSKIKTSMTYIDKPLRLDILKQEWSNGETTFGIKENASNSIVFSSLIVQNLEQGTTKKTQKTAGLAPSISVYDEIGKYAFLKPYLAALPSFKTPYGFKCLTVLAGCVCKGTKVWDKDGRSLNIEDLKTEDGIIGYSTDDKNISVETISYWQKPHKKDCYRIITNKNRILECSDDHPILKRKKFPSGTYDKSNYFVEAKDIKVNDSIAVIEEVNIWGHNEMFDPRFIGWLVGDGTYGKGQVPKIMNADPEMVEYVKSNYDTKTYYTAPTKDGRTLHKITISGITKPLRNLGIYGQTRDSKRLPYNIHTFKKQDVADFIGGYYDADGCAYLDSKGFNSFLKITSANKEILEELRLLLQKFGIHCNIDYEKPNFSNPKTTRGHFNLIVKDMKSIKVFYNNIKFSIKAKQEKLEKIAEQFKKRRYDKSSKDGKNLRYERVKSIDYIGIQDVYNLTADNTHTYIANGIVTHNTGGEADLSKDAMDVLSDPESFSLLPMDWDLLQYGIDPEYVTWKPRIFATFFPGQMAYEEGFIKEKKSMSEFTGIKNKELEKIDIHVTNWKDNGKYLKEEYEKAKNSKNSKATLLAQQRKVQYPIDPEDCFLSSLISPFTNVIEDATRHRQYLIDTGRWDRRRNLYKDSKGVIHSEISTKPLVEFPFSGSNQDAPYLIIEDIPDFTPPKYMFVASADFYKQETTTSTDSVCTVGIYKYPLFGDPAGKKLVASYAGRPQRYKELNEKVLLLLQAYNAIMLPENEDLGVFQTFLESKRLEEDFLEKHIDFNTALKYSDNDARKWGYTPKQSKRKLLAMYANYLDESVTIKNDENQEVTVKRVQTIDDIWLLSEIINYSETGNYDRISGHIGAIGLIHVLEKNYIYPKGMGRRRDGTEEEKKKPKQREKSFYATPTRNRNFYRNR